MALQLLGRLSDAASVIEEAPRFARESGHLFSLGQALAIGGSVAQYRREPEVTRARAEEAVALCEENGFLLWLVFSRALHGWALAELGQLDQGIADMETGIAGIQQIDGAPRQRELTALLAQGYAKRGEKVKALAMLDGAPANVDQFGEGSARAEVLRIKGELLLTCDSPAEAEDCFRRALEVARAQEAKWWELRATTSLARLLRDTNRRDEARAMLAEIYDWFAEGFDLPDLKDAKALLDELNK